MSTHPNKAQSPRLQHRFEGKAQRAEEYAAKLKMRPSSLVAALAYAREHPEEFPALTYGTHYENRGTGARPDWWILNDWVLRYLILGAVPESHQPQKRKNPCADSPP